MERYEGPLWKWTVCPQLAIQSSRWATATRGHKLAVWRTFEKPLRAIYEIECGKRNKPDGADFLRVKVFKVRKSSLIDVRATIWNYDIFWCQFNLTTLPCSLKPVIMLYWLLAAAVKHSHFFAFFFSSRFQSPCASKVFKSAHSREWSPLNLAWS